MANNRSLHYTFSLRVDSVDTLTPVRPLIGTVAGKSIPGTNLVTQDVSSLYPCEHNVARLHVLERVENQRTVGRCGHATRALQQFGRQVRDARDLPGLQIEK